MISDQRQVISDTFHTSLVSTASEHMSFVSYCSLIHGLKVVLSQLVIELQALSMIGTSYKKRDSGEVLRVYLRQYRTILYQPL